MNLETDPQYYLGIDGGGTKTAAWLGHVTAGGELQVLGRGIAGAGNPSAMGMEGALENVRLAIKTAFLDANLPFQTVGAACISLAGIGRAAELAQVHDWAVSQQIATRLKLATDPEIIVSAAENEADKSNELSVALIAGTGSIAWGKSAEGQTERCGGWGYLLGDEGGGYDLGLQSLRQACQTADGRRTDFELLAAILAATHCTDPPQLISWAYGSESSRERIAGLAPIAFEQATTHSAAQQIVKKGAVQLAELVRGVTRRFERCPYSLFLAGGLLCNQPDYVRRLRAELERIDCVPDQVQLIKNPVLGALRLSVKI